MPIYIMCTLLFICVSCRNSSSVGDRGEGTFRPSQAGDKLPTSSPTPIPDSSEQIHATPNPNNSLPQPTEEGEIYLTPKQFIDAYQLDANKLKGTEIRIKNIKNARVGPSGPSNRVIDAYSDLIEFPESYPFRISIQCRPPVSKGPIEAIVNSLQNQQVKVSGILSDSLVSTSSGPSGSHKNLSVAIAANCSIERDL